MNTLSNKFTPKLHKYQKIRWFSKWLGLFFVFILFALMLTPLFINTDSKAVAIKLFLTDHSWLFLVLHLIFAVSSLWWYPLYIKRRAALHQWSDAHLQQALHYKWWVMTILLVFAFMLWIL